MIEEKGLDPEVADKIGEYVQKKGGKELLDELLQDETLISNESFASGIKDMSLLFNYLEVFCVMPKLSFDLSLARGVILLPSFLRHQFTQNLTRKPARLLHRHNLRSSD